MYSYRYYFEMMASYEEVGLIMQKNLDLFSENEKLRSENRELWSEKADLHVTISIREVEYEKLTITKNQLNSLLYEQNYEIKRKDRQIQNLKSEVSHLRDTKDWFGENGPSYRQLKHVQSNFKKLKQTHAEQIKHKDFELQRLRKELDQSKANPKLIMQLLAEIENIHKNHQSLYKKQEDKITDLTRSMRETDAECNICRIKREGVMAFNPCGHIACCNCASKLSDCHLCREKIKHKIKLYF